MAYGEVEEGVTYTIDLEGAQNGQGTLADPVIWEFMTSLETTLNKVMMMVVREQTVAFNLLDESGSYYIAATVCRY